MDEAEHARIGVHLSDYARMTYSAFARAPLPKYQVAALQTLGVIHMSA